MIRLKYEHTEHFSIRNDERYNGTFLRYLELRKEHTYRAMQVFDIYVESPILGRWYEDEEEKAKRKRQLAEDYIYACEELEAYKERAALQVAAVHEQWQKEKAERLRRKEFEKRAPDFFQGPIITPGLQFGDQLTLF